MKKNISYNEIIIIADFLANMHDWQVSSLEEEFVTCVTQNTNLSNEEALKLVTIFLEIPVQKRFNKKFSHKKFVKKLLLV
ncbi:MAG: hypothetical protein KBD63_02100 [Bacteriovoracaceae bacterium]|nr:hypothetical protein [Bacteriovoracaceae bacterium]